MKFITCLDLGILGAPDSLELWQEILDQIPDSVLLKPYVKILNIACGHGTEAVMLAKRMIALGIPKEKVNESMFLLDKYHTFTNQVKNTYGFRNVVTADFLEWATDMKFDVVIGNPPYQNSEDSGSALWSKFVNKIFDETIKDSGYVALIHPPSFIGKHLNPGKGKSDYSVFLNNQIEQIHIFDDHNRNKYFSGIGTRVCWYIARKSQPVCSTRVLGYNGDTVFEFETDFRSMTILPSVIDKISMSIHQKLISVPALEFMQKRELHYFSMKKKNSVSEQRTTEFKYKSYFSHKIVRYSNFRFSDYNKIKVMVPQTSTLNNAFVDKNCNVSEDLFYIVCDSEQDAQKIQTYLKSPLVEYIGKNYRSGRALGSLLAANLIPDPEHPIHWTADEVNYMNQTHPKA